ncbi:hypothetical protein SAMD00024442_7_32 [Candidatus Symbiothrix dinenymphae]|nr:hypothetical protein SAMD00024442_7_32 [Candidatus Symbiothrix dinenymphae]
MYKYWVRHQLRKYYKNNGMREKRFLNLKDVHTMLVLFDTQNVVEAIAFIKSMKKMNKKVTVYAYQGKHDAKDYSRTGYNIITAKETDDLFQKKLKEMVSDLKKEKYDAAIDLTAQHNFSVEYLLAHTNAKMKVGLKKNDIPQYDFSIADIPELQQESLKVRELANQLRYYLQVIQAAP